MDSPDLFEHTSKELSKRSAPLAARMRPRTFDEYVGQEHIVGPGRVLRTSIESDQLPSMILWGPPGSGKTTLARIIANATKSDFHQVSAVTSGVADLRKVVAKARDQLGMYQRRTVLFIDEIHRFNKAQQDVILPVVEDGTITLIGATTENPSFEVIAPLLSRSRVYSLDPLDDGQTRSIVERAMVDEEQGIGSWKVSIEEEALEHLVISANGDARIALNGLELASSATKPNEQGERHVELQTVEEALQQRSFLYDKAGDQHFDIISAFIKSLRASDPDASLYWMARMLEAGEDPLYIVRRMVILAAEDVGMADPQALVVAVAAQQAVHFVGMPEGFLPLAEAAIYLATAPKSNSALTSYGRAKEDVEKTRNDPVPMHLRNPVTGLMQKMGYGKGYKYAHSYEGHLADQVNLPERLADRRYYQPTDQGYEAKVAERMRRWEEERRKQRQGEDNPEL